MVTKAQLQPLVDFIKTQTTITPTLGIVLGTGLGPLADEIVDAVRIPYHKLPGMPVTTIHGQAGELILGSICGVRVACLKGRVHYYEGTSSSDFKILIRLLKILGCSSLLITNASGSLRQNIGAGELVLITDHINFQFRNPLIGPNDDEFGPRFFPMDQVYDLALREKFHETAKAIGLYLHEGVYFSVLGPNFET